MAAPILALEDKRQMVAWIRDNIRTMKDWKASDFRDFYKHDVPTLLELAEAFLAEHPTESLSVPKCIDCGRPYFTCGMDLVLTDEQWRLIHPKRVGILCGTCICRRADKLPGFVRLKATLESRP